MSSGPFDAPAVQFAVSAVGEAAQLVRRVQAEMVVGAITKDDRSPVTVADFAAQAVVAHRLRAWQPDAVLVGEENAAALRDEAGRETLGQITHFVSTVIPEATPAAVCEWIDHGAADPPAEFWTLDPVDGTKGFLRGDQYAVALALVRNGQVVIGALGCPELEGAARAAKGGAGSVVIAVRGAGVRTQPLDDPHAPWVELKVADVATPAEAPPTICREGAYEHGGDWALVERLAVIAPPVPLDSQAKYAVLAAGAGDVLMRLLSSSRPDYREKIWDQAAGSIVVEEAGGRVSDLDGKPLDFSHGRTLATNRGVLATNGKLHDAFLAGLRAIGA